MDRARRLAARDRIKIGSEIRTARLAEGCSLASIARAAGISASQASRIERGVHPTVQHEHLVRLGAEVGLDVRTSAYAGPDPVIDAGHLALLGRFAARLHPDLTMRFEVPLPTAGDQRAWDAVVGGLADVDATILPVEAETRLIDIQAQIRRIRLKCRDAGMRHVVVVVADTRRNREAIAAGGAVLRAEFGIPQRRALLALGEGRHPGGSALIVL